VGLNIVAGFACAGDRRGRFEVVMRREVMQLQCVGLPHDCGVLAEVSVGGR
jgi:hypothetical protein